MDKRNIQPLTIEDLEKSTTLNTAIERTEVPKCIDKVVLIGHDLDSLQEEVIKHALEEKGVKVAIVGDPLLLKKIEDGHEVVVLDTLPLTFTKIEEVELNMTYRENNIMQRGKNNSQRGWKDRKGKYKKFF